MQVHHTKYIFFITQNLCESLLKPEKANQEPNRLFVCQDEKYEPQDESSIAILLLFRSSQILIV